MNLNEIEKFAVRIRRDLTEGVDAALNALGFTDQMPEAPTQVQGGWIYCGRAVEDVDFGTRWERLKQFIDHEEDGRKAAVERAAYTWFNRLVAIRILAKRGIVLPQLEWADKAAHVPKIVHRMRTGGWKPNLTPGEDVALAKIRHDPTKTREQFAILVGAFCRETPILQAAFGEIDDWTMLLVPNNLLAEGGIVDCLNDAALLSDDDYRQDELIGWLYQYYIAERKAEVYDGFKKNRKAGAGEIPAATQIFTPNWIVKYLVENTLGGAESTTSNYPLDTQFIDPCCGSGHILLEGFRHLLAAYDELGYSKRDAIERIFANNLTGIDLDPRARQLSTFALLIAAANEDESFADAHALPRVFDTTSAITGLVENRIAKALATSNAKAINELQAALSLINEKGETIGSLLKIDISSETRALVSTRLGDVEDKELRRALGLVLALTASYSALVTNPPYLGAKKLSETFRLYLQQHYNDGKDDLCTAFILRLFEMCENGGHIGMITMHSWMFISSFIDLRHKILSDKTILSMMHLGPHVFTALNGEIASTTAFVLVNKKIQDYEAIYYRLVDGEDVSEKANLYIDACMHGGQNVFKAKVSKFMKIPGCPIAYWVSDKLIKAFEGRPEVGSRFAFREGIHTANNDKFLRLWYEVSGNKFVVGASCYSDIDARGRWVPYNKGGEFRRWYGNNDYVIGFDSEYRNEMLQLKGHVWPSQNLYFREGGTWTAVTTGAFGVRYFPAGFLFDAGGQVVIGEKITVCIAFLNSVIFDAIAKATMPTINYKCGVVKTLPDLILENQLIESNVTGLIALSRSDWDEYETSWDFKVNPLVREGWQKCAGGMSLEAAWDRVFARRMEWAARMKELEEENNRLFIEAYGLEDELKPDVAWKDVSITGNPFYRYKVDGEVDAARRDASSLHGVPEELEAKARADAMRELISYGMGILMGRYSLEQEGLILASQGETYQDYLSRVHGVDKIRPDDDGIIPAIALDGDIFSDNLLHRMREFLSAAFGNDVLPANLNFIEAALDCKFDKYLTERFFDDHVKTYRKRPIYWLFESPKGYFRAFAYMHRMTGATAGLIRNKYLLPYIAHLEKCLASESAKGSAMTAFERKRVKEIEKAIADCKKYDLTLHDIAGRSIAIDLDDGVVVNREKYKSVLARM